jgi:hypothetical protein
VIDYKIQQEMHKQNISPSQKDYMIIYKKIVENIIRNPENHNSLVTEENVWQNEEHVLLRLKMNYIIELESLQLVSKTKNPKFESIKNFLSIRYYYGQIDVPHENILS